MNSGDNIIGGAGIHVSRLGGTWLISFDPSVIPGPAAATTPLTVQDTKLADLTYGDDHSDQTIANHWHRHDPGTRAEGVKITLQTAAAYHHDGDQKLYAFVRDFTFDERGLLVKVSAERRIVIEEPQECP